MSAKRKETISESQLFRWKQLKQFIELLHKHADSIAPGFREKHGLRDLDRTLYFGLFLFGMLNPVITSMRSLCAATNLKRVQNTFGIEKPIAISSFSDAQSAFDPKIIQIILDQLLAESIAKHARVGKIPARIDPETLNTFDSTLWKVVNRMKWAAWRNQNCTQNAVRLHVKFRVTDEQPKSVLITEGKCCERAAMRKMFKAGEFYLGDRNYGADFKLFDELKKAGCGFVLRLRNVKWQVAEEHELTQQAKDAGATFDGMVRLGVNGDGGLHRVIVIERPDMTEKVMLVTSEPFAQLSTEEVGELYRMRWKVEIFFRWFKCLIPCRHWFAESENGVKIQIYLCLIEALLLADVIQGKPNKRMMELLYYYSIGVATEEELLAGLTAEQAARLRRQSKKS